MTSKAGAKWLEVLKPGDSGFEKAWDSLRARQAVQPPDSQVSDVIERMSQIRAGGDRALQAWTRSALGLDFDRFELPQEEWDLACESVDASDRAALGKAAMRIREFQRKRVPSSWEMREEGGGSMGQRVRPLSRRLELFEYPTRELGQAAVRAHAEEGVVGTLRGHHAGRRRDGCETLELG